MDVKSYALLWLVFGGLACFALSLIPKLSDKAWLFSVFYLITGSIALLLLV